MREILMHFTNTAQTPLAGLENWAVISKYPYRLMDTGIDVTTV